MIRKLESKDAPGLLAFFRELVAVDRARVETPEDAAKLDEAAEARWIESRLLAEAANRMFARVAEADGRLVAQGEVERMPRPVEEHVGEIRWGALPGYDKEAMALVSELAYYSQTNGIEVLVYFHLATQERGLALMKSAGFEEQGRIRNYYRTGDGYVDRVYLVKRLA